MMSVTFTPAAVKSKVLAPLHGYEKRLKSCMCFKKVFTKICFAPGHSKEFLLRENSNKKIQDFSNTF